MWTAQGPRLECPAGGRKIHMPKTKPPYPREFRTRAVGLVRKTGRRSRRSKTIWASRVQRCATGIRQAEADAGKGRPGALTTQEKIELHELKREKRILRKGRDIRSQAAAFFARESGSVGGLRCAVAPAGPFAGRGRRCGVVPSPRGAGHWVHGCGGAVEGRKGRGGVARCFLRQGQRHARRFRGDGCGGGRGVGSPAAPIRFTPQG